MNGRIFWSNPFSDEPNGIWQHFKAQSLKFLTLFNKSTSMKFILTLLLAFLFAGTQAQSLSDKKLQKDPLWIPMINDTTTNYFDAVEAFNQYWSVRPLPKQEEDVLGKGEEYEKKEGFLDALLTTKNEKRARESQQYSFEYKRFKRWQIMVEPWVKEDGSITTPKEQLLIWENGRVND